MNVKLAKLTIGAAESLVHLKIFNQMEVSNSSIPAQYKYRIRGSKKKTKRQ